MGNVLFVMFELGSHGLVSIDSVDVPTLTTALTSERARWPDSRGSAFSLALMLQALGYFPTGAAGASFFKTGKPTFLLEPAHEAND